MPLRLFKAAGEYFAPTDIPSLPGIAIQGASSIGLALWASLPAAMQVLAYSMLFDYLTGFYAAIRNDEWSFKKGLDGISRKALIIIGLIILIRVTLIVQGGGTIATVLTFALCINEARSSLANLKRCQFELPFPWLDAILSRLNSVNDAKAGPAQTQSTTKPDKE